MTAKQTRPFLTALLYPLLIATMLFVPAWSFDYIEIWIYCIFIEFFSIFSFFSIMKRCPELIERRSLHKEKRRRQSVIMFLVFFCCYSSFILVGLDHRFQWSNIPWYLEVVAFIVLFCSCLLANKVLAVNSFASGIIDVEKTQRAITTGPYRFVRHPLYLSGIVALLSVPIALGSVVGFVWCLSLPVLFVMRLLDEERFLLEELKGYKEYCQKTPYRLLPGVW